VNWTLVSLYILLGLSALAIGGLTSELSWSARIALLFLILVVVFCFRVITGSELRESTEHKSGEKEEQNGT